MKKIVLGFVLLVLFSACEKEEIALDAPNQSQTTIVPTDTTGNEVLIARGASVLTTISIGANYESQIWFDLGTNSIIKSNARTDWDLAFESESNDYVVYLNTSNVSSAVETPTTDFANVRSVSGLTFGYDASSGNLDSLAIGDVSSNNKVWIVDRGFSPSGSDLGKWKVKFESATANSYTLRFGRLNDSVGTVVVINKNPIKGRVAFSFVSGMTYDLEPEKTAFDLCFTQYTNVFYEPTFYPYSVNGAIINSYRTEVFEAFGQNFEQIDLAFAQSQFYSNHLDVIGYDWKFYDFGSSSYIVDKTKVYILKDASGNYFKLRFLDFYDENGVKGTPSFEYVRL